MTAKKIQVRAITAPGGAPGSGADSKEAWYGQAQHPVTGEWVTMLNDAGLPILYMSSDYARDAARLIEFTPVLFRKIVGGDVLAVFPTDASDMDAFLCGCYAHVGQHGSCDPAFIIQTSRPARPAEYADLKAELEGAPYHYRLRVYSRLQRGWRAERERQLKAIK